MDADRHRAKRLHLQAKLYALNVCRRNYARWSVLPVWMRPTGDSPETMLHCFRSNLKDARQVRGELEGLLP